MSDLVGQQLGNYSIVKLIGRGGFADAYLGEHTILTGRKVAIKVLHSSIEQAGEREKFLQEAQLLAKLEHPHILSIIDAGIYGDLPYLITTYAAQGTLRQLYPKGSRLPLSTILNYVQQVAAALQYAHEHKIIHRDVKPENMFLMKNDEVLLGDFGIATIFQSNIETQNIVGTASYMAPEQSKGKATPASDQYALGIVVYEWLSGETPFHGSLFEVFGQHMLTPPPLLRQKNPAIPQEIEQTVLKALEKDPERRFPSMIEFAKAFEEATRPVLLQTTITLTGKIEVNADRQLEPSQPQPAPTDSSRQPQPSIAPDAEHANETFLVSPDREATAVLPEPPTFDTYDAGQPITPFTFEIEEIEEQPQAPMATVVVIPPPPSILQTARILLAPLLTRNVPQTARRGTQQDNTLAIWPSHSQEVYAVAWSPDGHYLVSGGADQTVQIWDETATRKLFSYHTSDEVYAVSWSPNGQYVASAGADKRIQIWQISTARMVFSFSVAGVIYALAWSPDSNLLAIGGTHRIVEVWDVESKSELYTYSGHTDWVRAVAWSPNGEYIASASNDQTVRVWKVTSGEVTLSHHHTDWVRSVVWSPGGKYLVSAGNDQTVQIWKPFTGEKALPYTSSAPSWMEGILAVSWSPNGSYIALAGEDQNVYIWNPRTNATVFTYKEHTAPIAALAWSPTLDGLHIASASYDSTVRIWQAIEISEMSTVINNSTQPGTIIG